MRTRKLGVGLVLAAVLTVTAAAPALAARLAYNTWQQNPTTFCLGARFNYGPYLGVIGYAKVDLQGWTCGPATSVAMVTVTGDNVLHNQGTCKIGENSTNSLDHFTCSWNGNVEQVTHVLGPTERVFGMFGQTCDPPGAGGRCVVNSWTII